MTERGVRRADFRPGDALGGAVGVAIGAGLLYAAAIGAWPVSTVDGATTLLLVFVFCANGVVAGLLVNAWFTAVDLASAAGDPTRAAARPVWRTAGIIGSVVLAGGIVLLDQRVAGFAGGVAWIIAGWGVAAGLVLSTLGLARYRHNRDAGEDLSTPEQVGLSLLALLTGFTAGGLAMAVVVAVSAVRLHQDLPEFDDQIPLIAGIQGEYVALGDSYSAGEGLTPFNYNTAAEVLDQPESNRCHRSQQAYSQALEFQGAEPSERFVACSGAVINDIYAGLVHDEDDAGLDVNEDVMDIEGEAVDEVRVPPQVTPGQTYPEVGLVTLTIGGNDMLFSKIVRFCIEQVDCMEQPFDTDSRGPRFVAYPERQPLEDWLPATMVEVDKAYDRLFERLDDSFPNARIIVIGYPYLFPDTRAGFRPHECTALLRRVSRTERLAVRDHTDAFNQVLQTSATAAGLEYISPAEVWAGREPCGPEGQLTNALNPLSFDGSFHPSQAGQLTLADLVATYLAENPAPEEPAVPEPSADT